MAYEMKPGQGSAWPNENRTEDWHAPFRGKVMLPNGAVHYLDLYEKESNGKKWFSVKVGKEAAPAAGQVYSAAHQTFPAQSGHDRAKSNAFVLDDKDEDVPF
jgi:hypothetical protein